jgi:hypothetical protein
MYIFHRYAVYMCTKIAHFIFMSVMLNIGKLVQSKTSDLDKTSDKLCQFLSEL